MAPLAAVQDLAAAVPSQKMAAAVLAAGATVTILTGLIRRRGAFAGHLPAVAFVLLAAASSWTASARPPSWARHATLAAALGILVHALFSPAGRAEPRDALPASQRLSAIYLGAALLIAGLLMFHDLGGYTGSLQRWEASVVGGYPDTGPCTTATNATRPHCSAPFGFAHAFERQQSVWSYAARRLLWDEGLLSGGSNALLYGVPTFVVFHALGFSRWTLRLSAVIATLLGIVVLYGLTRHFFGSVAAGASAVLFGLNACVLFYGRYGSSPAATVLAVLLALWCTWLFLERERPTGWLAGLCATTLYAATLHYAPGRLVVLILLGILSLSVVAEWRGRGRQRLVGLAVIVAAVGAVLLLQWSTGTHHRFLFGRGEQFFYMTSHPAYAASLCPACVADGEIDLADRVELLRRWLRLTGPQYLELVRPTVQNVALRDWDAPVLPRLYYGPLFLFIVWGAGKCLRRWRSWPNASLLLWVGGVSVTLLLTNRVDSNRAMLLVIPLSIWGALGIAEAGRLMRAAGVPPALQHLLAAGLMLAVVLNDVRLLWSRKAFPIAPGGVVAEEVERSAGTVAVGALIDPQFDTRRNLALITLTLLERERGDPTRTGFFLREPLLTALKRDGPAAAPSDLLEIERMLDSATILLAPADDFRPVGDYLRKRGARVSEAGAPELRVLRIERG